MHINEQNIASLNLDDLKENWEKYWSLKPPPRIGRTMLERSLIYKIYERQGHGLTHQQNKRLNKLISTYKRNPNYFDQGHTILKPGMKLIRNWQGRNYTVIVTQCGFEYKGQPYSSLSKIANEITGSKWNGWLFFGLKNKAPIS